MGHFADPRDISLERRITAEAAGRLHADPEQVGEFIIYAEGRAGTAPVHDLHTRDFKTEVLEELADARNYLVWHVIQAIRHHDEQAVRGLQRVLAGVVQAALDLDHVPATRSIHA